MYRGSAYDWLRDPARARKHDHGCSMPKPCQMEHRSQRRMTTNALTTRLATPPIGSANTHWISKARDVARRLARHAFPHSMKGRQVAHFVITARTTRERRVHDLATLPSERDVAVSPVGKPKAAEGVAAARALCAIIRARAGKALGSLQGGGQAPRPSPLPSPYGPDMQTPADRKANRRC